MRYHSYSGSVGLVSSSIVKYSVSTMDSRSEERYGVYERDGTYEESRDGRRAIPPVAPHLRTG